jgi:hypothetical protein
MDLTPYTQSLRDDMLAAASVGDEQTRRAAALLTAAIEPAARLAIMNALSDLAGEVTAAMEDVTVELRLEGRDVRVAVSHHDTARADDRRWQTRHPGDAAVDSDDGDPDDIGRAVRDAGNELSRTTLRLFNDLKLQAEQAANAQGVSLNTYIQRAVSDAVKTSVNSGRRGRGNRTIVGYVQG